MEYLMEHPQTWDASAIYQTSPCERHDDGVYVTQVGLYVNLIMAVLKGARGFMLNSKTMMADSIHSTTDLLSDIMALVTVNWSLRPATPQFPYGYRKIESLGALGMSAILLLGGTTMGYCSLCGLAARLLPAALFHAPKQASVRMSNFDRPSFADETMSSMLVLGLSLTTVAIKEWLYRETRRIARERKSVVLASNAIHHRIDSLTEIVIIAVILGVRVMQDTAWLDRVGGLCISLMAVKPAAELSISALYDLADRSIGNEMRESISDLVGEVLGEPAYKGAIDVACLTCIKSGRLLIFDAGITVPGRWLVEDMTYLEQKIRFRVETGIKSMCNIRFHIVSTVNG